MLTVGLPLGSSLVTATITIAQQYPAPIVVVFVVGVVLVGFWLAAIIVEAIRNRGDDGAGEPASLPEPEPPRGPRTGIRTRGGSFRSSGQIRIRNQDRSIDSEDTDWETKDTDIE